MRRRLLFAALAALFAAFALVAAGCGGDDDDDGGGGAQATTSDDGGGGGGAVQALPASSCSELYYEGEGEPDFIIASDLPLQGSGRTQTVQMTEAVKFILRQNDFKAGDLNIGYQSCDDSTAQAGKWDSAKTSANANAYAQNKSVIGVIGTFNSGAAAIMIPILNRAPDGPLAMVSPANTYVGLTHSGPGTETGEPEKFYPTGKRNYIRLVAADDFQGAADAMLAKELGLKNVYVLNDKEAYGLGVATNFRNAAGHEDVGVGIAGFSAYDPKASSYEALATSIKAAGADGVFIGGLICENGGKLIKDLRAGLGPDVAIILPDGFTPISATVEGAGQAADNVYVSVAGQPNEELGEGGKQFVEDFEADSGAPPDPYSVYAAQSAQVLLDAIERSDGTRASVAEELFNTKVEDGILGSFEINENGDTNNNPVTVYQVKNGEQTTFKVITPPTEIVETA